MAQLQDIFQRYAIVKVLDFLTLYKEFEYTRTDIANETSISRRTLYQIWSTIERFDLVKMTKHSGMIKFYKLNMENPISKKLVALADEISLFEAERIAGVEPMSIQRLDLPESFQDKEVTFTVTERERIKTYEYKIKGTSGDERTFLKSMDLRNGGKTHTIPLSTSTKFGEPLRKKKEKTKIGVSQ